MSITYTPATSAPVDVTATAQKAGLAGGFRVVMAADAHHRACALAQHSDTEKGVRAVVDALTAALTALTEGDRALSMGTTWTIRTGGLQHARWTVLVAADDTAPTAVVLYITPA
ncbi:hypothetical protein [Kocuria turfanensis]|uniref:Uncharacterized protein n=1 Tax=Kocuria turfanensis TaxID=388357 RepID=A0A512II47_9MICC|nr:hypothetical protein [Kocuria turfanensis]GEO97318.1 hypothetical protein KTU01_34410 [Kocuria turfanensis]